MKRLLIIIAIALLIVLLVYACSSTIRTAGTSFVTVTIGKDAGTATLHAEKATAWLRFRHLLARVDFVPEADAYIPSVVQVIVVTVSAPDMTTIVAVDNVGTKTSSSITVEVPNGVGRMFAVEGIRGADSKTYYRGTVTADLTGADVTLPVSMNYIGPGILVDNTSASAADIVTCGTGSAPCLTISYALRSRATGTADVVLVSVGTYSAGSGESFPLQLNPGTSLIGLGDNYSTVIDSDISDAIYGATGASLDNFQILVCDATGIDDQGAAMTINRVDLEAGSCGGGALTGIVLAADSQVSDATVKDPFGTAISVTAGNPVIQNATLLVTGTLSVFPSSGIEVTGGSPSIAKATISGFPHGISVGGGSPSITQTTITGALNDGVGSAILVSAGSATVDQCDLSGNETGIEVDGGASASITGNTITGNTNHGGIYLWGSVAAPSAAISGNTIEQNNYGIQANSAGTSSIHDNSLSCNTAADFYLADPGANGFDVSNNAWDHDATTLVTGPTITTESGGVCPAGVDICYSSVLNVAPQYLPVKAAVAGGCQ